LTSNSVNREFFNNLLDPPAPPLGLDFLMELRLFTRFESMLDMSEKRDRFLKYSTGPAPALPTEKGGYPIGNFI
jgi:hypothetical protein